MDHKLFYFEHPCICFKVKYKNPKDFRKVSFELLLKILLLNVPRSIIKQQKTALFKENKLPFV